MKVNVKTYAVSPRGKKHLFIDADKEFDRLDKLDKYVQGLYKWICERSNVDYRDAHMREAKFHAAALWVACEKMQVINKVGPNRYVVELEVLSGEHDAVEA